MSRNPKGRKNKGPGRVYGDNYRLMVVYVRSIGFKNIPEAMVNGPRVFRNDFNKWISKKSKKEILKLRKKYNQIKNQ